MRSTILLLLLTLTQLAQATVIEIKLETEDQIKRNNYNYITNESLDSYISTDVKTDQLSLEIDLGSIREIRESDELIYSGDIHQRSKAVYYSGYDFNLLELFPSTQNQFLPLGFLDEPSKIKRNESSVYHHTLFNDYKNIDYAYGVSELTFSQFFRYDTNENTREYFALYSTITFDVFSTLDDFVYYKDMDLGILLAGATNLQVTSGMRYSKILLDNWEFSSEESYSIGGHGIVTSVNVPEPSTISIFFLSTMLFIKRQRRKVKVTK